MTALPSDLAKFIDDLRGVREATGDIQFAWDEQIAAFDKAVKSVSEAVDVDADFLDSFDQLRAIARRRLRSLRDRLDACFKVLDVIKLLSDRKIAFTRAQMAQRG
jgi:hypothetical protein